MAAISSTVPMAKKILLKQETGEEKPACADKACAEDVIGKGFSSIWAQLFALTTVN